jgi:hypothetical protein
MNLHGMLFGRATYGRHSSAETARRPEDYRGRHRAPETIAVPAQRPEVPAGDTAVVPLAA